MKPDEHERLGSALERYAARARQVDWASPSELRRAAVARRHKRRALAGSASMALAALVAISFAVLPSTAPHHPGVAKGQAASAVKRMVVPQGAPDEVAVENAEQRFALALTDSIVSTAPTSNVVVSPESLAATLSMLELGAHGATQQEIAGALGSGSMNPRQQAEGWDALTAELASEAPSGSHTQLVDRNALFVQKSLNVLRSFTDSLKGYYGAAPTTVDFRANDGSALETIDDWARGVTRTPSPLFGQGSLSGSTDVVAVDAVRFSASWASNVVFPANLTAPADFLTADNRSVSVPMMRMLTTKLHYLSNDRLQGVVLPYAHGPFEAIVVEPDSGSIASFVRALTPASLNLLAKSLRYGPVRLRMPSFSVGSNVNLDSALQRLGMVDAFNSSADFSGIAQVRLDLEAVAQSTQLSVGRFGTDASAASGGATTAVAGHGGTTSIVFDHPFIFVIRDTVTNAILFDAVVSDPCAS